MRPQARDTPGRRTPESKYSACRCNGIPVGTWVSWACDARKLSPHARSSRARAKCARFSPAAIRATFARRARLACTCPVATRSAYPRTSRPSPPSAARPRSRGTHTSFCQPRRPARWAWSASARAHAGAWNAGLGHGPAMHKRSAPKQRKPKSARAYDMRARGRSACRAHATRGSAARLGPAATRACGMRPRGQKRTPRSPASSTCPFIAQRLACVRPSCAAAGSIRVWRRASFCCRGKSRNLNFKRKIHAWSLKLSGTKCTAP